MRKIFLAFSLLCLSGSLNFASAVGPLDLQKKRMETTPAVPATVSVAPTPETKPQPAPEVKPETKPEVKPEVKAEPAPEVKKEEPKKEEAKPVKKTSENVKATTWFSKLKNAYRMAISFEGKLPKYSTDKSSGKLVFKFDSTVEFGNTAVPQTFKDLVTKVDVTRNPKLVVTVTYNPSAEIKITPQKSALHIDLVSDKEKKEEETKKAKAEREAKEKKQKEEKIAGVKFSREGKTEKIKIAFDAPVPAAVFERFGYFWIVFDTQEKKEFKPEIIAKSDLFETVEKLPSEILVFKLTLKDQVYANANRTGNVWEIEFDPDIKYQPATPLSLDMVNNSVKIAAKNVGRKITLTDDFTGDVLQVIPLLDANTGVPVGKDANGMIFEKTAQGILYRNYGKDAQLAVSPDGIMVTKEQANQAPVPRGPVNPIYKFQKWKQFNTAEFEKQKSTQKTKGGLAYGKFLFSQKIYNEAANYLTTLEGFEPEFLAGAAKFMDGKYDEAFTMFNRVGVPTGLDSDELDMWKMAAEFDMLQQQYDKQQITNFAPGFRIPPNIENYPPEIAAKLVLDLTERKINDGDLNGAQSIIDKMPKEIPPTAENYKQFLQGLIYDKNAQRQHAKEIWDKLATAYDDRKTRSHAVYYSALQDYELGKVPAKETGEKIDKVRIIWRGDRFEYQLLRKLGDIYLASENNISALRAYREAVLNFPNHPDNEILTEKMRMAYSAALTRDLSSSGKAFEAVALYYEFQELKPTGEEGDRITGELAEKLADFDLLKEAAELMQRSLDKITDNEDRALTATRVAILKYMNHDSKGALDMLNQSQVKNIPAYIQQERDVLAINAMMDLKQNDAAKQLLAKLPPERGSQVKADMFWKEKKWREMVEAYNMVPDKSPADVMKIAIARVMMDDKKGLAALKKQHEAMMQKSEYAEGFKVVTEADTVDYRNLPASLNLDSAHKLITEYKKRMQKGGIAAIVSDGKTPAPATAATATPAATPAATPPAAATPTTPAAAPAAAPAAKPAETPAPAKTDH